MININCFSQEIRVFHGKQTPEPSFLVGYGALIELFQLNMPFPEQLAIISRKHKKYETPDWRIYTPRHQPKETLLDHLVFALKYEGINLLFFKKLFEKISKEEIIPLVKTEPLGQYCRKIWFLYEWLFNSKLDLPDLQSSNYVNLIDENIQFALKNGEKSSRHRIINNLPGTVNFCPLVFKTNKLTEYSHGNIAIIQNNYLQGIRKDILQRASAFLLLKDSKASFTIEGENAKSKRAARWGQAIGQAGIRDLSKDELLRLQQMVIENPRFTEMGYRQKGGFVGEHDRVSSEPIPDHISAKWQDVDLLMQGLIDASILLTKNEIDAVISAASIAFGFVFIHPFVDGNGRIHRYLIHHILAKKEFSKQGFIFPVSAAILEKITDYRVVLENYSLPLLDFIQWKETKDHNIEVLNVTIDFYRYFDATKQAEFLYDCVNETIQNIIPKEVEYLTNYDFFKQIIDDEYEMPDQTVALLVRFLEQNNGSFSKRAKEKEFAELSEEEIQFIENKYQEIFKP